MRRMNLFYLSAYFLLLIKYVYSEVVSLDAKSLEKDVFESKDLWIVGFYNIEDSSKLDTYENLLNDFYSKASQYNIKVGLYNCLKDKSSKKQCLSVNAMQLINFILFDEYPTANPYTRKLYRTPKSYQGIPENVRSLEKFLSNQFNPTNFKKIEEKNLENIDNYITSCSKPTIVILSGTKSLTIKNILYKSLAYRLSTKVDVVLYKATDSIYPTNKLTVSTDMTVHLIQPKKEPILYNGDTSDIDNIIDFVTGIVDISNEESDETTNTNIISPIYSKINFTQETLLSDNEWIIAVIEDANVLDLFPKWSQIETNAVGSVKSVILKCVDSDDSNAFIDKLCNSQSQLLPYITVFPYSEQSRKKFMTSTKLNIYKPADIDKLIPLIGKTLPDDLVTVIPESEIENFMKLSLDSQKIPTIYLVDDVDKVSLALRNVMLTMIKSVNAAVVVKPSKTFIRSVGLYSVPSIVTMLPRIDSSENSDPNSARVAFQPVVYDPNLHGSFKYENIIKFLKSTLRESIFNKEDSEDDDSRKNSNADSIVVHEVVNNATWFDFCPPTFRGLCVIYLTNTDSTYDSNVLLSVTKGSSDNLARSGTVKLIHIDGQCKLGFTESFGLQTFSLPTVISYFPFKNRFAVLKSSLSESSVKNFVNSLLTGTETTIGLSARPIVEDSCVFVEEISVEGDSSSEDASDFLAEILAEEKARQLELKKAVEEEKKRLEEEKKRESEKKSKKGKKKKKSKK